MYLEQNKVTWQPSTSLQLIKQRADLLKKIRNFFEKEHVVEVDTPLLCQYGVTAPYLNSIQAGSRFLQTSPEYAMKRLLAAGSGDIFQICKAFRKLEIGNLHNPEFTMLEWYRLQQSHYQLMDEVDNLLHSILDDSHSNYSVDHNIYMTDKISYRAVFKQYLHCDPILASLDNLKQLIIDKISLSSELKKSVLNFTKQQCQELLFSSCIEPNFKQEGSIKIIYNYPIDQAALSKISLDDDGEKIAERFEVYVDGVELANGYHELTDVFEQQSRFMEEQRIRYQVNKEFIQVDPYLMAALEARMPNCSGVALGIDRLLMIKTKSKSIKDVINFCWDRA